MPEKGLVLKPRGLVGREDELSQLAQWFDDRSELPVMSVYGPVGTGKTALAASFADSLVDKGFDVKIEYFSAAQKTVDQVVEHLGGLLVGSINEVYPNENPSRASRQLVILDGCDLAHGLDWFLTNNLLPSIHPALKVLLLTRKPFSVEVVLDPLWRDLSTSLYLGDLSRQDTERLLSDQGVSDPELMKACWEVSRGRPLILHVLSKNLHLLSSSKGIPGPVIHNVYQELIQRIACEITGGRERFLEAAALSWVFDWELLEKVTGPLALDEFTRLIGASFVHRATGGYRLDPVVREVVTRHLVLNPQRMEKLQENLSAINRNRLDFRKPAPTTIMNVLYTGGRSCLRKVLFMEPSRPFEVLRERPEQEPTEKTLIKVIQGNSCLSYLRGLVLYGKSAKPGQGFSPKASSLLEHLSRPCLWITDWSVDDSTEPTSAQGILLRELIHWACRGYSLVVSEPPPAAGELLKLLGFCRFQTGLALSEKDSTVYWLDTPNEGLDHWVDRILNSQNTQTYRQPIRAREIQGLVKEAFYVMNDRPKFRAQPLVTFVRDYFMKDRNAVAVEAETENGLRWALKQLRTYHSQNMFLLRAVRLGCSLSRKELARSFNLSERTFYRKLDKAFYQLSLWFLGYFEKRKEAPFG